MGEDPGGRLLQMDHRVRLTFYWGDWYRKTVLGPERAATISPARWAVDRQMIYTSHHDAPVALPNSIAILSQQGLRCRPPCRSVVAEVELGGDGCVVGPALRVGGGAFDVGGDALVRHAGGGHDEVDPPAERHLFEKGPPVRVQPVRGCLLAWAVGDLL